MAVNEFFTITSVTSLGVATAAVNVTTNALYRIAKFNRKITAFIIGLGIAYLGVLIKSDPHWAEWAIAFLNGCLLFCTAMGMNDVLEASPARKGLMPDQKVEREPFFSSWHRR